MDGPVPGVPPLAARTQSAAGAPAYGARESAAAIRAGTLTAAELLERSRYAARADGRSARYAADPVGLSAAACGSG